jgi:hypothetical protein
MLKNKIKTHKNALLAISMIAIFAIPMLSPLVFGISYPRQTQGYITVAPTLIGVGQEATVTIFAQPFPTDYGYKPFYPYGYSGITVTFIRPDGTKDTFMPTPEANDAPAGTTDTLGSMFFYYTPNMAGNWSVTMSMPAQNLTDFTGTAAYTASTSEPFKFTVTTEPQYAGLLTGSPWQPLPNSNTYWTWPINSNNREWAQIAGEWLGGYYWGNSIINGGNWQQYGSGPSTAHILWTENYNPGGIIGGDYGSLSYTNPSLSGSHNVAVAMDVILNGKLFHNLDDGTGFECIDLMTGNVLWTRTNVTRISYGIHLFANAFAQATSGGVATGVELAASYGSNAIPYLLSTTSTAWNYYNTMTGALGTSISITNATTGTAFFVDGTPLAYGYVHSNQNTATTWYGTNYIYCWNMTKVVGGDWKTGIQWTANVSNAATGQKGAGWNSRSMLLISSDLSTAVVAGVDGGDMATGFDATTGKMLYNVEWPYVAEMTEALNFVYLYGTNNYVVFDPTFNTWHCYSMPTGKELWATKIGTSGFDTRMGESKVNDDKNVYFGSASGTVTAVDMADGHIVWQKNPIPSTEYPSNSLPVYNQLLEANGIIYAYGGQLVDSYQLNPIQRFGTVIAINATNGDTIFTLNGGLFPSCISGGNMGCLGTYDGIYYMLGKGKTSTSITIQNDVVASGATILIKGNILDQSPAQAGTPAVSDASMSEWMDYLHMQNATLLNNPPQETGVPVILTAVDPNGNIVNIGTTTTDSAGNYGINFVPQMTGLFTIKATFAGTNSYWPSSSETKLTVTSAAATATPTASAAVDYMPTLTGILAAVVLAIIVSVIALVVVLRRH